ncbi:MAG: hypothetical protein AB7O52_11350 [Planctomycetota bacterium]
MYRWIATAAVVVGGAGLWCMAGQSHGQEAVIGLPKQTAPGGTVILGEGGASAFPLVFQLGEDNEWTTARTQLVERAAAGSNVEVVYALLKVRSSKSANEKLIGRIDSVLGALTEAELYPLTTLDIGDRVAELTAGLERVKAGAPSENLVPAVLLALEKAAEQIDRATRMIETGKEIEAAGPPAGAVIRRRSPGQ